MSEVILIAAVGRSGQLGLSGVMPWHDAADLRWFQEQTCGHVVVVGVKTAESLPVLPNRTVVVEYNDSRSVPEALRGRSDLRLMPAFEDKRELLGVIYRHRRVFVAGGSATYKAWLASGLVRRTLLTHVDYDGPADALMPALWGHT